MATNIMKIKKSMISGSETVSVSVPARQQPKFNMTEIKKITVAKKKLVITRNKITQNKDDP